MDDQCISDSEHQWPGSVQKELILALELLPSCRGWWLCHCPAPSAPPPMRRGWSRQESGHKPIVFCHSLTTETRQGWWSGAIKSRKRCQRPSYNIYNRHLRTTNRWPLTSLAKRRSVLRSFLLSIRRCLVVRLVTLFLNLSACLATTA